MFCTGDAPTVPGMSARFSSPPKPCSRLQVTASCQFSPAPNSRIVALGPSSSTRRPATSTFSTTAFTSPVSTMLLPPPSTNIGSWDSSGWARTPCTSAAPFTRTRVLARATMPNVLGGCSGALDSTIMGELWPNQPPGRCRRTPHMPSFDTVCEPNMVEVKNAVENAAKEIGTRFDFKGTAAAIEVKDKEVTLTGEADFQLQQIMDVLIAKLAKRKVDVRFLDKGEIQKAGGDKVKQVVKVRSGIESEQAKKLQRLIKDSKLKVQAAIQGDVVRITGAKKDDLQAVMALVQKDMAELPLSFTNFRD